MARVVLGTETQSAGANREVAQGGFGIQGLSLWESSGFIAVRHACNLPVSTCAFHNIHCKHVLLSAQAESPQDCLSIFCPLGKPLSACRHPHVGIAQIAFTPPLRTQTGTLGHFFSGAILPFYHFYHFFTIFFTIFSE